MAPGNMAKEEETDTTRDAKRPAGTPGGLADAIRPTPDTKLGRRCRIDPTGHQAALMTEERASAVTHVTNLSIEGNTSTHLAQCVACRLRGLHRYVHAGGAP